MPRTRRRLLKPPNRLKLKPDLQTLKRFYDRVEIVTSKKKCWLWTGRPDANGYGQIRVKIKGQWVTLWVHRFSYAIFKGTIPAGYQIDHRCRNPACVRPNHLFKITPIHHSSISGSYKNDDTPF